MKHFFIKKILEHPISSFFILCLFLFSVGTGLCYHHYQVRLDTLPTFRDLQSQLNATQSLAIENSDATKCNVLGTEVEYVQCDYHRQGGKCDSKTLQGTAARWDLVIETYDLRSDCFVMYATSQNDRNVCLMLPDDGSYHVEECLLEVAEDTGDASVCDLISKDILNDGCRAYVLGDVNYCYTSDSTSGTRSVENVGTAACILGYVYRTEDYKACIGILSVSSGSPYKYNECIMLGAYYGRNLPALEYDAICAMLIEDGATRENVGRLGHIAAEDCPIREVNAWHHIEAFYAF